MKQTRFTIATNGAGLYEFTPEVVQWVEGSGLLTLFIRHTSASLLIQENADPEVQSDLRAFSERLVPPSDDPTMAYLTHTYEGPDDMPAHIKAALLPVPCRSRLSTGGWGWAGGRVSTCSNIAGPRTGARFWPTSLDAARQSAQCRAAAQGWVFRHRAGRPGLLSSTACRLLPQTPKP